MGDAEYRFVTHWRLRGTCAEVAEILEAAEQLPRWWGTVYRGARIIRQPYGPHGLGQVVSVVSKGLLPYRLRWQFTVLEERYPYGSTIEARGDFVGRGVWRFAQDGDCVAVSFEWQVYAEKPLVRMLSPLLRPLFEYNHRWAMARGAASLAAELTRRRNGDGEIRN
jgi:hypothetical protein